MRQNPKPKSVLYADISLETKSIIIAKFNEALSWGAHVGQAISCAAHDAFQLTDREWNGKTGSNAFATACAVLIMDKTFGDLFCSPQNFQPTLKWSGKNGQNQVVHNPEERIES